MKRTLSPLKVANYRLYFTGQAVSLVGTWMQTVAQAWLVLTLTHSGAMLGVVSAAQLLPVLLLGPYAGAVADRVSKRKLLFYGNAVSGVLALALGLLCVSGHVALWSVFALAVALGLTRTFTAPGQQAFASEMVGPDLLKDAVSLNNVMVNAARAVGPAVAGLLIATTGVGVCFLLNAASFIAVLISVAKMKPGLLYTPKPTPRAAGQVRAGIRYVKARPELLAPLLMMALIGTFAYEFQVSLPLMAKSALHGDASTYGFMTAAMGTGSVLGGLFINHKLALGLRSLIQLSLSFGGAIAIAALAPNLATELACLILVGATSTGFMAIGASTLQLGSAPQMRGRVMALWGVAFQGSTPIGAPIIGGLSEVSSPRAGLLAGAAACVLCAGGGAFAYRRTKAAGQSTGSHMIPAT